MSLMLKIQTIIARRSFNWVMFLFCAGLIAAALYFQYVEHLDPCPLCIFQRVVVMALGLTFLIKALHHPSPDSNWQWVYAVVVLVVALVGVGIAGRHVWLQSLPEHLVPACGPALDYLLDALPFLEVIEVVMQGSGECAKDDGWRLLGLTMPQWTLIVFCGFTLLGLCSLWSRWRQAKPV
jgi:disulfide bond formation protein DsbB